MPRPKLFKTDEEAEEYLVSLLGDNWREFVIPVLYGSTSPLPASDLAENLEVSVQSMGHACSALIKLDLLTAYIHVTKSSGKVRGNSRWYLLGELQDYDKDEFILDRGVDND